MKTLDELAAKQDEAFAKQDEAIAKLDVALTKLEKRVPISRLPFTINEPGSYYLVNDLRFSAPTGHAIVIEASDVTLDLMGFTLSSSNSVTGDAIRLTAGMRNIAVKNGVITGNTTVTISGSAPNRNWTVAPAGFANGINGFAIPTYNCHFAQLRISGCRSFGLAAADQAVIEQVNVRQNGATGIVAAYGAITGCGAAFNAGGGIDAPSGSVSNCTARSNEETGISAASVANSLSDSNGDRGIDVSSGSVTNSTASANDNTGISAFSGTVTNCTSVSNSGDGISASQGSVTSSTARFNDGDGIVVPGGVVAFCMASNNAIEIDAAGATRTGNNPTP